MFLLCFAKLMWWQQNNWKHSKSREKKAHAWCLKTGAYEPLCFFRGDWRIG